MGRSQSNSPKYFNNSYLSQNFGIDRNFSEDELDDVYGFANGLVNNQRPDSRTHIAHTVKRESENYVELVQEFSDVVDEESYRYEFMGETGGPDYLGKRLAGHFESRSIFSEHSEDSEETGPQKSEFRSGRKVNLDRLEKQGELDDSIHYDVMEYEDEINIVLDGEVEELTSSSIELEGEKDITLSELGNEYGDLFGEEITNIDDGKLTTNEEPIHSSVSTIVYEK